MYTPLPHIWTVFIFLASIWTISLVAQTVKRLPTTQETQIRALGREGPLEKEMATHSSTLAWTTPRMEERGRLPLFIHIIVLLIYFGSLSRGSKQTVDRGGIVGSPAYVEALLKWKVGSLFRAKKIELGGSSSGFSFLLCHWLAQIINLFLFEWNPVRKRVGFLSLRPLFTFHVNVPDTWALSRPIDLEFLGLAIGISIPVKHPSWLSDCWQKPHT